jgi:hypothetical protein
MSEAAKVYYRDRETQAIVTKEVETVTDGDKQVQVIYCVFPDGFRRAVDSWPDSQYAEIKEEKAVEPTAPANEAPPVDESAEQPAS